MSKLDNTYQDTWNTRIKNLNGLTYQEYLESDHWERVKYKASLRSNYQKCEFCPETKVELHHKSYKWINTKFELSAIIALCRKHHQKIHDYAKDNNVSIRISTKKFMKDNKRGWYSPDNPYLKTAISSR